MAFWKQVVAFIDQDLGQMAPDEILEWARFWVQEGGFWLFPKLAGYLNLPKQPLPFGEYIVGDNSNWFSALQLQYEVAKEANEREKIKLIFDELKYIQEKSKSFLDAIVRSEKLFMSLQSNNWVLIKEPSGSRRFLASGPATLRIEMSTKQVPVWLKSDSIEKYPMSYVIEDHIGVLSFLYDRSKELPIEYIGCCPVCSRIFWKSRKDKVFCQRKCQSLYFVRRARMQKKIKKSS